jgi:hypothetical protein
MKPNSANDLDLLDQMAVTLAREKRGQYLDALDDLVNSFDAAGEAASIEEIRALFRTYEQPGMPTLSSQIEAMREER